MKLLSIRTVMVPLKEIKLGEHWFSISAIMEVLEGLEGTDGYFDVIVINDDELKDELEKRAVIATNIRGGSYRGKKFAAFQKYFDKQIYDAKGNYRVGGGAKR